jgi:small ligand-binding sensory domain FIST
VIRAGAGLSIATSTERAAREAAGAAASAMRLHAEDAAFDAALAFAFVTTSHLSQIDRLLQIVCHETGAPDVVGCTGYGVLGMGVEIEALPGVAVLAVGGQGLRVCTFLETGLQGNDGAVAAAIARRVRPALPPPASTDAALLVVLPDAFNLRPGCFLGGIERELEGTSPGSPPVAVVGGVAAEDGPSRTTHQFGNGKCETNGVAGALVSGPFVVETNLTQSCRPHGALRTVTRASGNVIYEIDGRPAFEVFTEVARPPLIEDLRRAMSFVFVGIPLDPQARKLARGEYLVRNVLGADAGAGALVVAEPVAPGGHIGFVLRDADGAREDLKGMLGEIDSSLAARSLRPRLGLYFNCSARGRSLYGYTDIDAAYLQRGLGEIPLAGFFGNGEITAYGGRARLHGYSGVLTLLCERASA